MSPAAQRHRGWSSALGSHTPTLGLISWPSKTFNVSYLHLHHPFTTPTPAPPCLPQSSSYIFGYCQFQSVNDTIHGSQDTYAASRCSRASRPVHPGKTGGGSGPCAHGGAYCSLFELDREVWRQIRTPSRTCVWQSQTSTWTTLKPVTMTDGNAYATSLLICNPRTPSCYRGLTIPK